MSKNLRNENRSGRECTWLIPNIDQVRPNMNEINKTFPKLAVFTLTPHFTKQKYMPKRLRHDQLYLWWKLILKMRKYYVTFVLTTTVLFIYYNLVHVCSNLVLYQISNAHTSGSKLRANGSRNL